MTSWRRWPLMRSAPSLQKTIFFCMSTTHSPAGRFSRMLRQTSESWNEDMIGRGMIPDYWVIGEIHSSFRDRVGGFRAEFHEISTFQTDRRRSRLRRVWHGSAMAGNLPAHSIFLSEQFWGRAARAPRTRKSSGRSLFLRVFLAVILSRSPI